MKKCLLVTTAFILTACVNTTPLETSLVYINTGEIQCGAEGKTGAETALILTNENIDVSKTQCGHLSNVVMIAMCGAEGTSINVHEIARADLEKAQSIGFEDVNTLKQEESLGYDVSECIQ